MDAVAAFEAEHTSSISFCEVSHVYFLSFLPHGIWFQDQRHQGKHILPPEKHCSTPCGLRRLHRERAHLRQNSNIEYVECKNNYIITYPVCQLPFSWCHTALGWNLWSPCQDWRFRHVRGSWGVVEFSFPAPSPLQAQAFRGSHETCGKICTSWNIGRRSLLQGQTWCRSRRW